jgi:hypothetical protein
MTKTSVVLLHSHFHNLFTQLFFATYYKETGEKKPPVGGLVLQG